MKKDKWLINNRNKRNVFYMLGCFIISYYVLGTFTEGFMRGTLVMIGAIGGFIFLYNRDEQLIKQNATTK